MRATTTPALSARLRGAAAGAAAAALALTLVPSSAVAQETSRDAVAVRLKVADQPPVDVATVPRVWPGELLETQGVPVDGNDLVDVVRDGREVSGPRKRLRHGDDDVVRGAVEELLRFLHITHNGRARVASEEVAASSTGTVTDEVVSGGDQ